MAHNEATCSIQHQIATRSIASRLLSSVHRYETYGQMAVRSKGPRSRAEHINWGAGALTSQERSAPAMSDRLKNERSSSYKKDSEMAAVSTGVTSSSPRITSSSSTNATTTPSVLSLHQSSHHHHHQPTPSLHHHLLQHHHLHQPPGGTNEGTAGASTDAHQHHHHQQHLQQQQQQQQQQHQQHNQHQHNGGLTSLSSGHSHSPLNSPTSSSGGASLSPYGLSPHGTGSGATPAASGGNMLAQPYASDASGFGPIYHHHHHHHHHNPLAPGGGASPYMNHPSFVDKYKLSVTPPPGPPPPPNTLTPPGPTYTGHYQGFYAGTAHPAAGMISTAHHTMTHGTRATVASIACRDRPDHGWYPCDQTTLNTDRYEAAQQSALHERPRDSGIEHSGNGGTIFLDAISKPH
uniref:Uncharacterized protein n=1 Tax=Anopheles dirus TaxID=7168 RepID=A0A182NSB8_9DIPT